ncbi:L-serine dehydratase, iron-sulfur-dependent subunit beta [Bombiscardovia apis]|uniref:L-serine ammonia-lyase n=1 Tax=Bombiscardovia apis TaxID=2932182 RepID=A0ABN6SGH7_9BIFI|nr:serine dehydratase beta chain [Bombiscardovia apis]BDR55110.1 L-serine dehydratase, iron-sulfur-dependent subunit beta [Bombiscardovia apis]
MAGEYRSVFDIIGPIMVGPSSSHTAGAVAIGRAARHLIGGLPSEVRIDYYESFAKTHLGHGTDYAIISGLLGFAPDDGRVPHAVSIARDEGVLIDFCEEEGPSPIGHPNTAVVHMRRGQQEMSLYGCSIGGGTIEIRRIEMDGYDLRPGGMLPLLIVPQLLNESEQAVLAQEDSITSLIAAAGALRNRSVYPSASGRQVMVVYDLDKPLLSAVLEQIRRFAPSMIYVD